MRSGLLIVVWTALGTTQAIAQKKTTEIPSFKDYPITEIFSGPQAAPVLATPEQRLYRTRIRNGVLLGQGVFADSEFQRPLTKPGINFAGKYVVIVWGCGSQCVMMATVDATTGIVYAPPLSGAGSELYVPLDNLSEMKVGFQPHSSLMILRNACRDFKNRNSCGTYYFNWHDNRFDLVKFIYADPLKGR